jgi:glucose/arabinose dehydrogenase
MRRAVVVLLLVVLAGCGGTSSGNGPFRTGSHGPNPTVAHPHTATATPSTTSTRPAHPRPRVVGTIARHLDVPWGIAFLPDRSALVTERDSGDVLHLVGRKVTRVGHVDVTHTEGGEDGLLGIAVSPSYSRDHRVFLYASTAQDNRVLRATFDGNRLRLDRPVLTGIPHGAIHNGGRLAFGPDGRLYVSTGETGNGELAQDEHSLGGKILRITQDGRPAPGNPDPGSPVWTLGHRNVEGLAFDPAGRLWASELGDQTWDELNLIQKGTNYGWPEVEGKSSDDRFRNPQVVWHTDEASPSGLAYDDGYLWMGSLRGERLWRIRVHDGRAVAPRDFFVGEYGRMRTVVRAPDGDLWVTTSNRDGRGSPSPADDRILLVRP